MNPFQAIMGRSMQMPMPGGQTVPPMMGGPFGALQGVMQRAKQLAGMFQNPQQMVQQYFPDAPSEVSGNPEQLIGWLEQTGRATPEMIQMARQMCGGR